MKLRKLMAGTLAATMVIGSGAMAFAADETANGATGTGTSFEHMNTEITSVTLPTASQVAGVFNFYVDPERAVNSAGKLADGTAVTANDEGVYFKVADGAPAGEGTDAEASSYSIDGVTTGLTVTVPTDTKLTSVTYKTTDDSVGADGWYDVTTDPATPALVSGINVTGDVDAALNTGDIINVTADTGAGDASVNSYTIGGETTGLTVTVPANATMTKLEYATTNDGVTADGWYESNSYNQDPSSATMVNGVTVKRPVKPVSGDTIGITPATEGALAGGGSYDNSSKAVAFSGMNSVDVDVSVTASVTASAGGKDIALVADEDALAAATTPALLMQLRVGSDPNAASEASDGDGTTESMADIKAITSTGATAKATIAGKPDNFKAETENGKFVYKVRTNTDTDNGGTALDPWDSTTVQLIGKTNEAQIPAGAGAMTAPTIELTWSVDKTPTTPPTPPAPTYTEASAHGNWSKGTLWLAKDASTGFSSSSLTVEVSDGGENYTVLASDKYAINDANWVSTTWANISGALGGTLSGTAYVRITDGTTRYTFVNN